jgi:hypothetical protein
MAAEALAKVASEKPSSAGLGGHTGASLDSPVSCTRSTDAAPAPLGKPEAEAGAVAPSVAPAAAAPAASLTLILRPSIALRPRWSSAHARGSGPFAPPPQQQSICVHAMRAEKAALTGV